MTLAEAKAETKAAYDIVVQDMAAVGQNEAAELYARLGPGIAIIFGAPGTKWRRHFLDFMYKAEREFDIAMENT